MAKVLIVDDSRTLRKILQTDITACGHDVIGSAENGQVALDFLQETDTLPDFVTLDITMPVMDGLETLDNIIKNYPTVKVIMVSASGQERKITTAIKTGAIGFIQKPLKIEVLSELLEKHS